MASCVLVFLAIAVLEEVTIVVAAKAIAITSSF